MKQAVNADQAQEPGISKLKLALGAASLFLFLVGVKRTFRTDEGREIAASARLDAEEEASPPATRRGRARSREPKRQRG